ncbi:SRS domain-containing protein [Neospora caninum Liverpool]|uniref:SRS domain-containing protein n=1 Tax=Neospora caninum (strain Liverpool) TaxID=572307 RepID=F0VIU1_NEOCL|nr:SRS domain-containing protein [Neospora caninum Liverpool]CBZ53652.1 SRS domain-containing protein [Neospora caninum Liverpool]CEL67643.1 TPA: SRS domain-containing protein [Neospora caninum Liverpool]|eukprot:XP_003883684.1 SRS domain-containing protein [Neospora caninum Liverpool]
MALSSRVNRPGSEASGSVLQVSRGFEVRMGLRVILVFVSTFLLLDFASFFGCVRTLAEEPTEPACVTTGAVTKCTCTKPAEASNTDITATLSEEKNALEIGCKSHELKCAPDGLESNEVCPSTTASLKDCENGQRGSNPTPFDINTLLSGSSKNVSWKSCNAAGDDACTTKKLEIPRENFPFVDKSFVVGCVENSSKENKMKVTVTLEARASATEEQTVTCAYGVNSNKAHQTVTLTPEKNSFTLVCGDQGDVLPTNYKEKYCVSEIGTAASESCTGAYNGVFPNYEETWWTTTANTDEYRFTIPEGQFPADEQKITVGCQKKATAEPGKQRTESEEKGSSVCSVDVTIVASAASPATLTSGMVVVWLSFVIIVSSSLL